MVDSCDLILHVDNKAPTVSLSSPAVVNPCGVVPVTATSGVPPFFSGPAAATTSFVPSGLTAAAFVPGWFGNSTSPSSNSSRRRYA